jgi:hypothetical protein
MISKYIKMKMNAQKLFFLLITLGIATKIYSQAIFIGPTIHYNFGSEKRWFSYGIEASLWVNDQIDVINPNPYPPYGFDIGYEWGNGERLIYSEFQVGVPVIGTSHGIVMQWSNATPKKFGYQGSLWCAFFAGVDARIRIFKNEKIFAPGIFGKVPVYYYDDPIFR